MSLSIVVPVDNSSRSVCRCWGTSPAVVRPENGGVKPILVNNGSRDRSWAVIRDLVASHRWIRGFQLDAEPRPA